MTLEKHIMDTMKEWQIKIGSFDSNIRLYYPKVSICRHLNLDKDIDNELLCRYTEHYFTEHAQYLGNVRVSAEHDRFCVLVDKTGCDYVEKNIEEPEFLTGFLSILKSQDMQKIIDFFEEYAKAHETKISIRKEENGLETAIAFENECVEPYVYCIDQNEFGITYHRFTKEDFEELDL